MNEAITKRFNRASPLLLLTGSSMGLGLALEAYGIGAMWAVAGREATWKFILGEGMKFDAATGGTVRKRALVLMGAAPVLLTNKLLPSLSMKLALPFVSFVCATVYIREGLQLMKCQYTMYHAMHDPAFFAWPPSPQLAMAIIPYIRSTYFNLWRETVLPYEIKLNRQLLGLPPLEENNHNNNGRNNGNGGQNNNRDEQRNADGGLMGMLQGLLDVLDPDEEEFEGDGEGQGDLRVVQREVNAAGIGGIEVELVIEEVDAQGAGVPVEDGENERQAELAPIGLGADREDAPEIPPVDVQAQAGEPHIDNEAPAPVENFPELLPEVLPLPVLAPDAPAPEDHEAPQAPPARRPSLGTILLNISNAVVGALALPVISYAAGEMLRQLILPRSWTMAPVGLHRTKGLMQEQWGRSVVGGCAYVVVRDVLRVYAKQRKVAAMGTRRVKNVERKRK